MKAPLALILASSVLALGACGGDDDSGSTSAKSDPTAALKAQVPDTAEPIQAFADRVEKAITASDCPALKAINKESTVGLACPSESAQAKKAFAGFEVTGVAQYGTGGSIDYTAAFAPKGATIVANVGEKGQWGVDRNELIKTRSVGTKIADKAGFDRVLTQFLGSISDNDCQAFFKTSITASQNEATACRKELPNYAGLRKALAANPSARPFLIGGNSRVLFYGVLTSKPKPEFRTATVVKTGPMANEPYLVSGTLIGPKPKKEAAQ